MVNPQETSSTFKSKTQRVQKVFREEKRGHADEPAEAGLCQSTV